MTDMQPFLVELKRLAQVAVDAKFHKGGNTHRWIQYYPVFQQPESPSLGAIDKLTMNNKNISMPYGLRQAGNNPLMSYSNVMTDSLSGSVPGENSLSAELQKVKEEWAAKEMLAREAQYATFEEKTVFIGTWNVNEQIPSEDLSSWLSSISDPDLYILGFQEVTSPSEGILTADSKREQEWCEQIELILNTQNIEYSRLVGMLIVFYGKNDIVESIKEISVNAVGGNKGAVGIRVHLRDTVLCFINCHLSAHSVAVDRRNQDFAEITRRLVFPISEVGEEPVPNRNRVSRMSFADVAAGVAASALYSAGLFDYGNLAYSIFDSDYVFWFGDLNYRIDLPDGEIKDLVAEGKFESVLEQDQLNKAIKNGQAFEGFDEGSIIFPPTFKYDIGTSTFDTRAPAWCDRILWRNKPHTKNRIEQQFYHSHMDLKSSDHKPVSSQFEVLIRSIAADRQAEVHIAVLKELDKFENECMPDANISEKFIDFGTVKYLNPITKTLEIENISPVLVQFRFVPKLDEVEFCKPWLWVNPPHGVILPDNKSAPNLNYGEQTLDDILILHLENGKDYFLSIAGQYVKTCFAQSLERLARLNHPVRQLNAKESKDTQLSLPRELWRIVDFIYNHGVEVDKIFRIPGDPEIVEHIKECLDTGEEFDYSRLLAERETHLVRKNSEADSFKTVFSVNQHSLGIQGEGDDKLSPSPLLRAVKSDDSFSVNDSEDCVGLHAMAEVLVRFLDALPEPVIPHSFYQRCLDSCQYKEAAIESLENLPRTHLNVFLYLTSFLREVISRGGLNSGSNQRAERILNVFSSIILRPPRNSQDKFPGVTTKKRQQFLRHFLIDDEPQEEVSDDVVQELSLITQK